MGCPWRRIPVATAITKCPFLSQIAEDCGEEYAASLAVRAGRPATPPTFPEALTDCRASFELFHGAYGVVPLVGRREPAQQQPHSTDAAVSRTDLPLTPAKRTAPAGPLVRAESCSPMSAVPLASLGTSIFRFLPGPGHFIARRRLKRQERRKPRARGEQSAKRSSRSYELQRQQRLDRWRKHPLLGGLIPLNAAGRYACPPLVVAGRSAVARWRSVQFLRPQALPVKLLGVGGHCFAANVPCGAVREHTEKFSAAWFLAVHATVPFFAFMRKGVGMPKWAILLTLVAALAGQTLGSRLERTRLKYIAGKQRGLGEEDRPRSSLWQGLGDKELLTTECRLCAMPGSLQPDLQRVFLPSVPIFVT